MTNKIFGDNLHLSTAVITLDSTTSQMQIIVSDEYIRALQFQKVLRKQRCFSVSGDLLYSLLSELLDHINGIFQRILLTEVEIDDENKTMLFLRKFSRSSEIISNKLSIIQSREKMKNPKEDFE
ncbi:MAG: hypothetical protein PF447_10220, partial [Spirochaetaceae bacterium]|jgi:hypothetical protein|nr:hypothetical protein [Spirochaetaceae bacterium]